MKTNIEIHADDYGYSLNTSKQIIDCIQNGQLDGISLICNTEAYKESMELFFKLIPSFAKLPYMTVHLDLVEGIHDGELLPMSWGKLFLYSFLPGRKELKQQLKDTITKQIRTCQRDVERCMQIAEENGVECNQKGIRIDSHVHTHLVPIVWKSLTEVIEEEGFNVEYIRNPKEPLIPFLIDKSLIKSFRPINFIKNRMLMLLSNKTDHYCDEHKIVKMYMCGLMCSGHMDIERLNRILPELIKFSEKKGRRLEVLFHPGRATEDEYSSEKNETYFREFNSSTDRDIEREAVSKIKDLL